MLVAPTSWGKRVLPDLGAMAALIVVQVVGLAVQLTPRSAAALNRGSTGQHRCWIWRVGLQRSNRLLGHIGRAPRLGDWGDCQSPIVGRGRTGLHRLLSARWGNEISWLFRFRVVVVACVGLYLARGCRA